MSDVKNEQVHAAAVAITPWAWEPGAFYWSDEWVSARDDSLDRARAALEAVDAVLISTDGA